MATHCDPHTTNSTTLRSPTLAGAFPPEGEKDSDHICQASRLGQDNLSNILNRSLPLASHQFGSPVVLDPIWPHRSNLYPGTLASLIPKVNRSVA